MSRIDYSGDEEYPGEFALFRSNVNRSLQSKRGRAALVELREALLALSSKRLTHDALVESTGAVCAIGAVCLNRVPPAEREAWIERESRSDHDIERDDPKTGFPRLTLWRIVEENDESLGAGVTPEFRYEGMLKWVETRLAGHKIDI